MIIGLQIIAVIFSLFMIYFAIVNYKRGEINKTEVYSWILIWLVVLFIVIFPQILRTYSERFFITRLFDLLVVGGFILVIGMTSVVYIKVRRMEKKLEELVRKEAMKNVKKKKK